MLRDERYAWPMNDPLVDFATVPPIPWHADVLATREPLARLVADLLAVPDDRLAEPWTWRRDDPEPLEGRDAMYRIHERLEAAITAIDTGRSVAPGPAIGPAVPPLAAMTAARWDLHGVLWPLDEATWDAAPGEEWSIRRTLAHIIGSQRSYGWNNAWYLRDGVVGREVPFPPDDAFPPEPSDEDDGAGSSAEVRTRLDSIVDANAAAIPALDDAAMRISARWSGLPVAIDFRLGRYGSHIREHTIQVDKTLAMLGLSATETARMVRLVVATYGRLEARFVGRRPDELERPLRGDTGSTAVAILAAAMDDAAAIAAAIRAGTPVGGP
jgi:hypothetical protein